MNPFQVLNNAWKNFDALPATRKMSLVLVVALTVLGIWGVVYFTNQIDYRVLFTNLSSEDASGIVSKLQEKKVPYQLSSTGDTISVPSDRVSEMRLELAAAGIPQGGGVGFEIFDKKMMGATEFEQQLNYRRALQGELSRTINSLDEIQASRVHIVIPKDSLFVEQQKKPTASVTVKLKSGRTLRPPQIEGIAHLVASSIEGLSPSDVMIVDGQGNILSKNRDGGKLAQLSNSQVEYQQNLEREMAGQIRGMLENVVGSGKAVVKVAADLDFRVTEKTEETFDPEGQVVRSTQKQSEKSTPAGAAAGGSQQEKADEIVNYEITKVVSKTVMPMGEIRKLSIAVLVDGIYAKDAKGAQVYQAREKKDLDTLDDLVRKSAGFNANRGDQVVVTNMQFQKMEAEGLAEPGWTDRLAAFMPIVKYAAVFAAIFIVFMFVLRPLVKGLLTAPTYREAPLRAALPPEGAVEYGAAPALAAARMGPAAQEALTETDMIRQLAGTDSKKFAELLRNWMK